MSSKNSRYTHPTIRRRAKELRQLLTPAERKLWQGLRRRQLNGYYFRRQHPIGQFVVDFYCAEARLIIEVDGDIHATQTEYDNVRTAWLEERGYSVIRFSNRQVFEKTESVLERILVFCRQNEDEQ